MTHETNDELDQAWQLLEQGDTAGARKLADRMAPSIDEEGRADLLLLRAACAREEGDSAAALDLLKQTIEVDPEWVTPELWTAELLMSEGRGAEALPHAARALELAEEEDEFLEAIAVKAGLEIELGKLAAARQTLGELPPSDDVQLDPVWGLELGHLLLAVDDSADARRRFQALADADPELADAWYGVGLAAEAQDDENGKREAWTRVLKLDERQPIEDSLLSEAEMATVAEQALAELPERARTLIQNVPILIADLPAGDDVATGLDPRLLGLFAGTAHPDASNLGGAPHLTQILLFRKNLERVAGDVEDLKDEIRTTLLHETGHFFGMSEDDLEALGLE
jgi:predicted Zn-dependent protease with MMP-like domain/thioredoxin-like negative regulator of GroEL